MTEEYLLAWNDHHSTFFQTMSELIAGDVLTDVSIWAGQTMYSAHRLVLALSSSYFRFVVTGTAQEGKFPVIFLKDVSSKDFERLLSYMYHGEVSVPQAELLSLISAAKSLGIRGLVEDVVAEGEGAEDAQENSDKDVKQKDARGEKREADFSDSQKLMHKKPKPSFHKSQPNMAHKSWHKSEGFKSSNLQNQNEPLEEMAPQRSQKEGVVIDTDEINNTDEKRLTKDIEQKSKDKEDSDREVRIGPKNLTNFFEVNVKQEEDENPAEDASVTETAAEYLTPHPLSLVRRSLLPSLLPNSPHSLPERRGSSLLAHASTPSLGAITRNTGTCHFCGRSFMKNKQLMNHVCPMRHAGK